jgi:hypothetical protein
MSWYTSCIDPWLGADYYSSGAECQRVFNLIGWLVIIYSVNSGPKI